MAVPRRAKVRTPAPAAVVIESHPTRVSPLIRGILAAPACDSPRYRCHSHPLALVLISHDLAVLAEAKRLRLLVPPGSYHFPF